jgi:hypothetical protein
MSKGPVYHYTYGRWRLDGWWRQRVNDFSDMRDVPFFARLDLNVQGLAHAKDAVAEKDYERAKSSLTDHFRTRRAPEFHFDWQDREKILSAIEDEQIEATIYAADQVCQNVFRFRRIAPVRFENGIDWMHCPGGNTDWTWDLNRHPYFITLGQAYWYTCDVKYIVKVSELLLDWIASNPAGVGRPNWDSVLEVAVRLNTWIWAFFFFRQSDDLGQNTQITLLKGILTHARYLHARIERHAANNHLLLEAKALAFCGILFPEFSDATGWRQSGLRILWNEVEKQVCADGVHGERAPLYHRRILSDLLEMLVLLENNGLRAPEQTVQRIEKMLDFDINITKPDGTIPLFSDSALTEIQARFSHRGNGATLFGRAKLDGSVLDEDMAWLLAKKTCKANTIQKRADRGLASRAFPQGGYYVMRAGTGEKELYLAFDCGPFGYEAGPIHGHADALSFDLYAYGQSLITDCGVYSYHLGQDWRNYFRGTRAHNTIAVDDRDQSVLLGTRYVHRPAQATLHAWTSNGYSDFVDGSHDGYCRLTQPVTHRRKIFFVKPEYWIVIDLLTGPPASHRLEQFFHLMPWATVTLDKRSKTARIEKDGNLVMTITPLAVQSLKADVISGMTDPIQGWVSFYSGEKVAAPVLRYSQDGLVPASFVTVLYPCRSSDAIGPQISNIDVISTSGRSISEMEASALTLETAEHVDTFVMTHNDEPSPIGFAGYESDGRLVYARQRKRDGVVSRAILQGGRTLSFQGRKLVQAHPNDPPQDIVFDSETTGNRD